MTLSLRNFGSTQMKLLSLALCLSGGFQQGYIATVLNQPYIHIQQFINQTFTERFEYDLTQSQLTFIWSALNTSFPLAVILGQFAAAWICKAFGRRKTGLLAISLYLPGTLLCFTSNYLKSFELLFAGRLLWSFANGIQSVNATVWIVECSPPYIRGAVAAMQEFSMALGSLVCQGAGIPFSNPTQWPMVFLPNVPFLLIAMLLMIYLPDSPHSIIERDGDSTEARRALALYYGVESESFVLDDEMDQMHQKAENDSRRKISKKGERSHIGFIVRPWEKVDEKSTIIRRAAWLGVMVKIAYVFTGARCLRTYSTFLLFQISQFSYSFARYSSFAVSLLRLLCTLVPVFLVDRVGRRPLINISLQVTMVCLITMIVSIQVGPDLKVLNLVAFSLLLLINSCGLGSVSRFYAAEMVPKSILLSTTSILSGLEILLKIASEFAWFPLANAVGSWSLLEFLVPSTILSFFIGIHCPETSGKTVNQVLNEMAAKENLDVRFD